MVDSDLVRRQMENEERVITGGIAKFREGIEKARSKGIYSETMPGVWLVREYIEPLSNAIKTFIKRATAGKPGPNSTVAPLLNLVKPDVLAFLTLKHIVNAIMDSKGEHERANLGQRIGDGICEEIQYNHMRVEDTQTFKYWTKEAERAADPKTKKRCIDRLKKNFDHLPKFETKEQKLALNAAGDQLLVLTLEATGMITFTMKHKPGPKYRTACYVEITPEHYGKLQAAAHRLETLWPKYEPMVCPPKPWDGAFRCGFVGKLGARTKLVRTGNRSYLEDLHHGIHKMDNVLRALNAIQATPWRVNRLVYETMREAFELNSGNFGLPGVEKLPNPPTPANIKTDKKVAKDWVNELKVIQKLEKRRVARVYVTKLMLTTAKKYRDEPAIWFAHNLDWRGRVYPLSSYLSPQGDEAQRALLEFAEGLPLETDEAVQWLAIHGANCWGYDKVAFPDRIRWVRENETLIRQSAAAPLDCTWWVQADKPWMFLAWCFDWVGYLDNGVAHVSHLPVAMDGSCNGLQNFAAMLKHEETARAVNLAPSEVPNDIYQLVADKVKERVGALAASDTRSTDEIVAVAYARTLAEYREKDEEKSHIRMKERTETGRLWNIVTARWIAKDIDRKLVKRPVMTYPYSVTIYGMGEQLLEMLLDMRDKTSFPPEHTGKVAVMLKHVVFEAIQETVTAAAKAMQWLREAARVVAKGNLPVTWTSPIGMLVMQNYWKSDRKQIRTNAGGIQYRPVVLIPRTGIVDPAKQASGVAPNFVHSCDASHLMFTVLACLDHGINHFHMIHDSYGTHARNASTLARLLREQFVAMYGDGTVLEALYQQLKAQVIDKPDLAAELPRPPEPQGFDLNQVLKSKYFFA